MVIATTNTTLRAQEATVTQIKERMSFLQVFLEWQELPEEEFIRKFQTLSQRAPPL